MSETNAKFDSKLPEHVGAAAEKSSQVALGIQHTLDLLIRLGSRFAEGLEKVGKVIPLLRLFLAAFQGFWALFNQVFIQNTTIPEKLKKLIAPAVICLLVAASIAVPPLGAVFTIGIVAVELIRELKHGYFGLRHLFSAGKKALLVTEDNEQEHASVKAEVIHAAHGAVTHGGEVVFAGIGFVGAVLAVIPPTAVVGLGLLVASVAVGLVWSLGNALIKHFALPKLAPVAAHAEATVQAETRMAAEISPVAEHTHTWVKAQANKAEPRKRTSLGSSAAVALMALSVGMSPAMAEEGQEREDNIERTSSELVLTEEVARRKGEPRPQQLVDSEAKVEQVQPVSTSAQVVDAPAETAGQPVEFIKEAMKLHYQKQQRTDWPRIVSASEAVTCGQQLATEEDLLLASHSAVTTCA